MSEDTLCTGGGGRGSLLGMCDASILIILHIIIVSCTQGRSSLGMNVFHRPVELHPSNIILPLKFLKGELHPSNIILHHSNV